MKQKNLIVVTIIVLCAVFLGEAYIHIHLGNIAAIPFIILGILLLTAAFFIIQKEVTAYLKHKETMEKESRDNLYRLLESRLYNIERYQKAIYNEAKSVRINTEELALNRELPAPSAVPASGENSLEDLGEELKKNMERVAKAVIKHSREDNEQLVEQLQELGRQIATNNDSRLADDPALETLEKLIQVCENGFGSLSDMAVHSLGAAFPEDGMAQAGAALEGEAMDVLSTKPDDMEEEEVTDTGLDAILGEAVLEEPSGTEAPVEDTPAEEESLPDIPDIDALLEDTSVDEEPLPDIPDIDALLEDTPVDEEPLPDIPDIDSLVEDTPADEDLNRQLTPEEIAAMFGGSEPVPKASETAPDEAIDSNRQLTPEEIAAMFSSM